MTVFVLVCISVLCGRSLTQYVPGLDQPYTQSQIQKLSSDVDFLKSALKQLILRDQEKDKVLTELHSDNRKLLQRVERLEATNANLEKEIRSTNEIKVPSKINTPLNSTANTSNTSIQYKGDRGSIIPVESNSDRDFKSSEKSSKRSPDGGVLNRIAFRGTQYSEYDDALQNGEILKFGSVNPNIGGGFDGHHGIFTADTAGVYVFFFKIVCPPHHGVSIELNADGHAMVWQYCKAGETNASNMAIRELSVGSYVFLRILVSDHGPCKLGVGTTLSGFLLYAN